MAIGIPRIHCNHGCLNSLDWNTKLDNWTRVKVLIKVYSYDSNSPDGKSIIMCTHTVAVHKLMESYPCFPPMPQCPGVKVVLLMQINPSHCGSISSSDNTLHYRRTNAMEVSTKSTSNPTLPVPSQSPHPSYSPQPMC